MISSNNGNGFITPAIFFAYDASKSGFGRNCVLDCLQGESVNVEVFQEFVIRTLEKKETLAKRGSSFCDQIESNFFASQSNAEILEQQRRDMERILREEERQKRLKAEEEKKIQKEVQSIFLF